MKIVPLSSLQQFAAVNVLSDPGHIPGPKLFPSGMNIVIQWGLWNGKQAHNVLNARYPGAFPGTVGMANAIMTALTTGADWTALATHLGTATAILKVQLRDMAIADQAIIESTNAAVPGTGAGGGLPDEVAATITLRTAKVGPANRGRMYIPGFAASANAGTNIMDPAVVTALSNWGNTTVRAAISAQGLTWVIAQPHRLGYTGSTGRVHPERMATSTDVTLAVCKDNHWDTIRKRGLK